jgi:hypothetical protein
LRDKLPQIRRQKSPAMTAGLLIFESSVGSSAYFAKVDSGVAAGIRAGY